MKHHMNEARLALYLRGDLSSADYRAVAQHVETCSECQSTLEDLSRSHELLVSSFEEPTPDELIAVRNAVATRIGTRRQRPAWRVWALAASAVVAVVILFANLRPRTQAPLPPAALALPAVVVKVSPPAPLMIPAPHRRVVRRAPTMTLLTRAERPALLKINTSDPNIVILWQLNDNEKAETP
jgi:anti-sigma factor RsiW